ncbi:MULTISPECIES: hypothetical protein [unclassified Streptomyces]|uniref:hypothetical protein n=1 Tax=unclassified Streptomyces TaxID=2593676 RepID=UPI002270AB5C|nr:MULTISPECIES: hypothetical protein [unclassified Streptomyces]MCY0924274.1 hypothetical protein [Streptomyces sp. H27-G5]MCY0963281.1 hypothetical protein [Streptomyces sp. H27-H5]
MTDRHTLSVLDWHEDGSCTWSRWIIDTDEKNKIQDLLARTPNTEGLVTPEQADEARATTRRWLSLPREDTPT